jgi:hypothetical protein
MRGAHDQEDLLRQHPIQNLGTHHVQVPVLGYNPGSRVQDLLQDGQGVRY